MVEVELKFQLPESKKNCPAILKTQSKEHPLTGKVLRYT